MKRFAKITALMASCLCVLMSCKMNSEPEVVEKEVIVEKKVVEEKEVEKIVEKEVKVVETETVYVYKLTETSETASQVWHFQQSPDGNSYVLDEKTDGEIPAGTPMEDFCKNEEGFNFFCMTQTGPLIFVFYDRKEVTYTFDCGDKGTFSDGSSVKAVKKLYGANVGEFENMLSEKYSLLNWHTEAGDDLGLTFGLENKTYYATWISKECVSDNFVFVPKDTFTLTEELTPSSTVLTVGTEYKIPNLVVSKYEVTVGDYSDLTGKTPSQQTVFSGDTELNPVNRVSFYDILVYCNMRSIKEKYTPCYSINGSTDPADWGTVPVINNELWNTVVCDFNADGYRLPTNIEWEYLARGGRTRNEETGDMEFQSYIYSGSNTLNDVAVTQGGKTKEVGSLAPNTLGIYDMTGNVWEMVWELKSDNVFNVLLRGSAIGSDTFKYPINYEGVWITSTRVQENFGFRVVRTAF